MSQATVLAHSGPWSIDDLDSLPDGGQRYEIIDGSLLMSPPPSARHQGIAARVSALLREAANPGLEVVEATGLKIGPGLLVPDVLVAASDAIWRGQPTLAPADVILVVEIVSPSSETMDRVTKPALYSDAGIPHFWRIEIDSALRPFVVVYRLSSGAYVEQLSVPVGGRVQLDQPFLLVLDPNTLAQ